MRSGTTGAPVPRVVVTGLGLVCALGRDLPSAWPRIMAGTTGVAPIRRFDASRYVASVAAEVEDREADVRLEITPDSHLRRGTRLFVEAAREAWRDARLDEALGQRHYASHDIAVAAGTSANYINLGVLVRHWMATRSAAAVEPNQGAADRQDETAAAPPHRSSFAATPTGRRRLRRARSASTARRSSPTRRARPARTRSRTPGRPSARDGHARWSPAGAAAW